MVSTFKWEDCEIHSHASLLIWLWGVAELENERNDIDRCIYKSPKQSVRLSPSAQWQVSGGVKWIGKIEFNRISVHIIGFNFQCQAK